MQKGLLSSVGVTSFSLYQMSHWSRFEMINNKLTPIPHIIFLKSREICIP